MAFNPQDPQQVQQFRNDAIKSGGNPVQVDAYIAQKQDQVAPQEPVSSEQPQTHIQDGSVIGFIKNVIGSGVNTAKDIGSAVLNVANTDMNENTVANLGRLGLGTIELAIPGEQGLEKYPKAVGNFYKSRYGSLQAAGDTFYNDPVGALLDASIVADLGGSALAKVGEVGKISKLAETGKALKTVGEVIDPLRLSTKGVGKVVNPKLAETGEVIEKAGADVRNGVSKIYEPASVYGAEREAKIAKDLDALGITGSAQSKYEKLQPAMEQISKKITSSLDANPQIVVGSDLLSMFKDNVRSLLRKKEISAPQAIKEFNGYISDITGVPMTNTGEILTTDLFSLKKLVNEDYQSVARKVDKGIPLNPREKVISVARQTLDNIIADLHPDVKELTLQQSSLFDAAESLNRSRKTVPTTRIAGTTVPASVMQTGQDLVGAGIQKVGSDLSSKQVPEVGMSTFTKSLSLVPRSEQLQNETNDTQSQIENDASYNELNGNQGLPLNPADVNLGSSNSVSQTPKTRNPFGANSNQIYEAYIKTLQSGNKRKAAILKDMFDQEVEFEAMKSPKLSGTAATNLADAQTAITMANQLDETIKNYSDKMGPLKGAALSRNPYDVDAQTFNSQMTVAAQIIGKYLEGGILRAEDTIKYQKILPQITDTPAVAKNKVKNIKSILNGRYLNQKELYKNVSPDILPSNPSDVQFAQ